MPSTKNEFGLLDRFREEMYYCNECRCGFCREGCCVYEQVRKETITARGFSSIGLALLDGVIEPTKNLAENVTLCTTCGWCKERCPLNMTNEFANLKKRVIDIPTIIENFRENMVKIGKGPIDAHKQLVELTRKEYNPFGEPKQERLNWLPFDITKLPEKADTVYFVGCMASYRQKETAQSTAKILQKLGTDFTILKDEKCCGSPLFRTGLGEQVKELLVKQNLKSIEETGAKRVVFACAGCYRTFTFDYPKIVGQLGFKTLHISQFLNELLSQGKLTFKEINKCVTYHDPCHLGRHANVYEEPRQVLAAIPGVKLVEMKYNRRLAKCCGAGGGFRSAWREVSRKIAENRIEQAKEVNAEAVVTPCPFCTYNLREMAGKDITIYDLTEIVAEAMGLI